MTKQRAAAEDAYVLRFARSGPIRWLAFPLWASIPVALALASPLWWPVAAVLLAVLAMEYSDDVRAVWCGLRGEVIIGVDEHGVHLGRDAHRWRARPAMIPWADVRAIELSRPPVRRSPHTYACVGVRRDDGMECRWVLSRNLDRDLLELALRRYAPGLPIVVDPGDHHHD